MKATFRIDERCAERCQCDGTHWFILTDSESTTDPMRIDEAFCEIYFRDANAKVRYDFGNADFLDAAHSYAHGLEAMDKLAGISRSIWQAGLSARETSPGVESILLVAEVNAKQHGQDSLADRFRKTREQYYDLQNEITSTRRKLVEHLEAIRMPDRFHAHAIIHAA